MTLGYLRWYPDGASDNEPITFFANPFLHCDDCGWRAEGYGQKGLWPCGHLAAALSRCPSWGPFNSCTCADLNFGPTHTPSPSVRTGCEIPPAPSST